MMYFMWECTSQKRDISNTLLVISTSSFIYFLESNRVFTFNFYSTYFLVSGVSCLFWSCSLTVLDRREIILSGYSQKYFHLYQFIDM